MLYPPTNVMYFYYRAQKQVRVTRSKYLYYAIINRVGGLARAIPGSYYKHHYPSPKEFI